MNVSDLQILLKKDVYHSLIILLICILFAPYVQYHWKRRRLYKMAAQRNGPLTLPFIGNALYFGGSATDLFNNITRLSKEFESPVRLWFGPQLYFAIWKPKDIETILNSPHALNKTDFYKFSRPIAGDGLLSAAAPKWKRHLKIIMPTMNQRILDGFVAVFSEEAEILAQQLKKETGKGIFDIFDYVSRCSLDTICATAMGIRVNAQTTESEFMQWVDIAVGIISKRMFGIFYYRDFLFNLTALAKEERDVVKKINAFARAVITEKKAEYHKKIKDSGTLPEAQFEEDSHQRKHFLQLLIELSEQGEKLTDEELLDEVKTIMIGASVTTSIMEGFILIVLGMFPKIQQKVYEEVIDVVGPDGPMEHTHLNKLRYLEMVIKETLRIFPVGHLVSRTIEQDIKLESCIVPAGSCVMMFLTAAHRDPDTWPNPLKFDPDRFLPEAVAKRHPYSWVPFAAGPRNCVGRNYAMMSMKVVVATVIRKYQFFTDYSCIEDVKLKAGVELKPTNGFRVSVKLRE